MSKRSLGLLLLLVAWIGRSGAAYAVNPAPPATPVVTETPDPVDIGPVVVGSSGTGDGMLSADVSFVATLQLAAGGDCPQFQIMSTTSPTLDTTPITVTVKLTPTSAGTKTCTVNVKQGATVLKTFGVTGTASAAVPQISVAPPALAFSSVDVGRTSATQQVTATNTGTGTLTISSATFTAGGASYTVAGTTGSQTVAVGASVQWNIACKPQAQGAANGTFQIVSNSAMGSPTTVDLTCSGNQGILTTDLASLDFGAVLLNGSRTRPLVLSNTGNVAVTGITGVFDKPTVGYSIDPTTPVPSTLAAGGSAMLTVKFAPVTPTDGGPAKITFSGSWGTGNTTTTVVNLTGQTVSLNVTPTALDFGNFRFDSAPTVVYHIINNGGSDVAIQTADFTPDVGTTASEVTSTFRKAGANVSLPQTLTGGQQLDVTVTARPNNRIGLVSGHIDVHSTTPGIPDQRVTVTGNATAAILTTSALIDFGAVDIDGASPQQTAMIMNTGTAILDISSIAKMAGASAAFTLTLPAGAIQVTPGTTLTIPITYKPTVEKGPGTFDSVVLVANLVGVLNGPTQAMITIQGRGIDRSLIIQSAPTFPPTFRNPGDMAPVRAVTVHNNGEALLKISAVMVAGNPVWQVLDSSAVDIPGGSSHDFMVRFAPTTVGAAPDGKLTLVNNDNALPMATVPLSGTGAMRKVALGSDMLTADAAIDLGFTGVGIPITAANILDVINHDQDAPFTIHAIKLSGDAAFRVEDAPADVALPANATKRFAVTFAPTEVADFTTMATLYLDQDPEQQATIQIKGHAVFVDAHGSGGCNAGGTGGGVGLGFGVLVFGALGRRRRRAGLALRSTPGSRSERA